MQKFGPHAPTRIPKPSLRKLLGKIHNTCQSGPENWVGQIPTSHLESRPTSAGYIVVSYSKIISELVIQPFTNVTLTYFRKYPIETYFPKFTALVCVFNLNVLEALVCNNKLVRALRLYKFTNLCILKDCIKLILDVSS